MRTTPEAPPARAAIVNSRGEVCFSATLSCGVLEVDVAGAVTAEGAPVNCRTYRVSRSKRNLALAGDGFNVPVLVERQHQGATFYMEVDQ